MKKKIRGPMAARYLGCSEYTLEKWRRTGQGPPFYKIGRNVLYDTDDLDAFLEANKYNSTAEYGVK